MDEFDILVTNDDGIDSPGLDALCDALSAVGSVTVVAPANDQSAVGRAHSRSVTVREHDRGYVIDGTPADCTIAGLTALLPETDLVVAGCNQGANLGAAVLGRSGTVSAVVEAAFFDVPGIAVSMYIPTELYDQDKTDLPVAQYADAVGTAAYLAEYAFDADVFETVDYLNVNAPVADLSTGEMVITRPSHAYYMDATRDGGTIALENRIWELMAGGSIPDADGTDRRAVMENRISVSPLVAPHTTEHHEALDALAEDYRR